MCVLQISGPETPDPTQLDLFDRGHSDAEEGFCSPKAAEGGQANEVLIRSPTAQESVYSENGQIFEFTETQQQIASSLLRKSRELVKKSIEHRREEDLARQTPQEL